MGYTLIAMYQPIRIQDLSLLEDNSGYQTSASEISNESRVGNRIQTRYIFPYSTNKRVIMCKRDA